MEAITEAVQLASPNNSLHSLATVISGIHSAGTRCTASCLVFVDARDREGEVATMIGRFPDHPAFDTHGKRTGEVVRLAPDGIHFWDTSHGSNRSEPRPAPQPPPPPSKGSPIVYPGGRRRPGGLRPLR